MRKHFLILLVALGFLSSCDENIDLTAPYKDITIVYGLLDHQEDTNWVRIEKAFLGDDDALLYAVIPDSLYYPASLQAYILGFDAGGTQMDSILLERIVDPFQKDSGIFAYTNNTILYRCVGTLDKNYTYKLKVIKPNGDTTHSETIMTGSTPMVYPPTQSTLLGMEPISSSTLNKVNNYRWAHNANTHAYQFGIRFRYEEWTAVTPVKDTSFTYLFPLFTIYNPGGGYNTDHYNIGTNQVNWDVDKPTYYQLIVDHIEEDPAGTPANDIRMRRFLALDFIVLQASEELYNYIDINGPSLSYVQKVTAYTNIENGVGIFGSRTTSGITSININLQSRDSLRLGQYTNQLNFVP